MFKSVMNVVIFLAIALFVVACSSNTQARGTIYTEGWKQVGVTSFYHRSLNGNLTANGERYRHYSEMTAAHRYLPFGTKIQVTDKDTGKSIIVRINDRGPFHGNRVLDLSGKAAENLGILKRGVCKVEVKVLSLPNRYLAKTKQVAKPIVPKAVADINSQIDVELANLNVKPQVFPQSRMDSIEDLISRTIR
mgnify:FL=1